MEVKTMNLARIAVAFSLAILQSACAATSVPLAMTPGSNATAAQHNSEGIAHYDMGHWEVAREHFASAIKADPNLAESHFNLALALDKLDLHSEATTHFKQAAELAPGNSAITRSSAYRNHTASPSSSYGTGGYGGWGVTRGSSCQYAHFVLNASSFNHLIQGHRTASFGRLEFRGFGTGVLAGFVDE